MQERRSLRPVEDVWRGRYAALHAGRDGNPARPVSPDPLERRIAPRLTVLDPRCSLGWEQRDGTLEVTAWLVDISRAGVALDVIHPPAVGRDVWLRLEVLDDGERVCGEVVGVEPARSGRWRVRIAFWAPCPDRVYHAALFGSGFRPALRPPGEPGRSARAGTDSASSRREDPE